MAELETRVSDLERNVDRVMTKLDMFIEESRAAREKQDADMKEMQKNLYAKMDNMDAKIEGIGNYVRNITIAAMVGIGAAVTGVAAMVLAVFLK